MSELLWAPCARIIENQRMLNAIRMFKHTDATVETCRDYLGVSRVTADKWIKGLQSQGKPDLYEKRDRTHVVLRQNAAMFLGISVGSAHIRVSLLGLDFEPFTQGQIRQFPQLAGFGRTHEFDDFRDPEDPDSREQSDADKSSFCFATPHGKDAFQKTRKFLTVIVGAFLRQAEDSRRGKGAPFPLMGIGIAVTGPVDYDAKVWLAAPERFTSVREITLTDLLGCQLVQTAESLDVFLVLDNNAKAAMVSEYQYLMEGHNGNYEADTALLYIGTGIGLASVVDQTLLRGNRNLSEIGQLKLGDESKDISIANVIEEYLDESEARYLQVLPYVLTAINCVLGIENVVLIGHSLEKCDHLIPSLLEKRIDYTATSTQGYCKVISGRGVPETSAIGAAIEAYFSMCKYDPQHSNKRVNLAHSISWGKRI